MSIQVLFFGKLADVAQKNLGISSIEINDNHSLNSVIELVQHIAELSPDLGKALNETGNLYAVNQQLCDSNTVITAGDEIALMSPLSGG